MARTAVLVLALLASLATPAAAGLRCARRPAPLVTLPELRLDEQGHWMRNRGETTATGYLEPEATEMVARIARTAKPAQIVECFDALLASPKSKAAKRACAVSAG